MVDPHSQGLRRALQACQGGFLVCWRPLDGKLKFWYHFPVVWALTYQKGLSIRRCVDDNGRGFSTATTAAAFSM